MGEVPPPQCANPDPSRQDSTPLAGFIFFLPSTMFLLRVALPESLWPHSSSPGSGIPMPGITGSLSSLEQSMLQGHSRNSALPVEKLLWEFVPPFHFGPSAEWTHIRDRCLQQCVLSPHWALILAPALRGAGEETCQCPICTAVRD